MSKKQTLPETLSLFNVCVHFEGAIVFEVESTCEQKAIDIAEMRFEELGDREIVAAIADLSSEAID